MREALVQVLNNDARVVEYKIAINECRHAVIRIEIHEIFRQVGAIDVNDFDVDVFLSQDQPRSMTVDTGRLGKKGHYRPSVGNHCHDELPSGMRLIRLFLVLASACRAEERSRQDTSFQICFFNINAMTKKKPR